MATAAPHPSRMPGRRSRRFQKIFEGFVEYALLLAGLTSIAITLAIAGTVIFGSIEFFRLDDFQPMSMSRIWDRIVYFFTGTQWTAAFHDARYGIWPLMMGTFWVALIACLIAVPIGLSTAIYLSEYASPRIRAIAKPTLELLAGIPTVVYGFFAFTTITPYVLKPIFEWLEIDLGDPFNQISGGIVVGIMIIPMVASLSEDALRAVPRSLRDASIALGATKYETSVKVVVPAALSGVTASFLLAISRAIGETMAVSLACGERTAIDWPNRGMTTMTSFIVRIAKGDVVVGTNDYNSLFAVAGTLFFITLAMNFLAQKVMRRYRMVYQ
jgi:phosphate transport system permease protein